MNHHFSHTSTVTGLQKQVEDHFLQRNPLPIALSYQNNSSFTTRTKSYKNRCHVINCGPFNNILQINPDTLKALVEPRVTMEQLVRATAPLGLTIPVTPEIKDITVGGAIMGVAGESSSHQWGCFNDSCTALNIVSGNGTYIKTSPIENTSLFHGLAGSYGSLGMLVSAEIQLIPVQDFVMLSYHVFPSIKKAVEALQIHMHSPTPPDFLEGLVFSKNLAVIITGNRQSKENIPFNTRYFSSNAMHFPWFYQHVQEIASHSNEYVDYMTHSDYLFRYDQGSFWMGSYLAHLPFAKKLLTEGVLKISKPIRKGFNENEVEQFREMRNPSSLWFKFLRPFLNCKNLGKVLHQAEIWIRERFIIQDFCIPENHSFQFLDDVCQNPSIFPIWLCPIKGTPHPQIFAPHYLKKERSDSFFINIGLYGIPSYSYSIEQITKNLEQATFFAGGRKVLYSHSYYTEEEFWKIYSQEMYHSLRELTHSPGIWPEITQKVLSV